MATLTMGFTSQYYTLWTVGTPYKKYSGGDVVNGYYTGTVQLVVDCSYMQNLSKDYDKAVEKIAALSGGDYKIDLDLRGTTSFVRNVGNPFEDDNTPVYIFTFGRLAGHDIREATDVWQLNRAMKEERGKRRRALARRRLIELGELVRNTTGIGEERYVDPAHLKRLQEAAFKKTAGGYHFENGKRITVTIKEISSISWHSTYGYRTVLTYYIQYLTQDGKLLTYKGSSPLPIDEEDGFVTVTGTVEHVERNEEPETRLKRMKLACKKAA